MSKHGIKIKQIGATWWGKRWIESVEHISRDSLSRLGRGRAYARAGHVQDLLIAPGVATACVNDADDELYQVTIKVAVLPAASWQKAITAMSKQAIFVAELLNGRMPEKIEDAFRTAGHHLFIDKQRELESECTCEDWVSPCKHVAAVHYVLGEAFDKDPFMLFELRGRTRSQVLGALRVVRKGHEPAADSVKDMDALAAEVDTSAATINLSEPLPAFSPDDFERSPAALPNFAVRIEPPTGSSTLLRQLGAPPTWNNDQLPFDEMLKLYHRAAIAAFELAAPELEHDTADVAESHNEKPTRARRAK
jgi:uncharacterized Zn finger protein